MRTFTYENQGADTLLVYHLDQEEHMDHFAKGMLQSNDISGILKPSFIQKDTDRYLKYPVTSKISLKDYLDHQMNRESVLKLCLSLVETVQELDEYMLSREKIFLHNEYLFVDVSRQKLSLLYVPVDEFAEETTVEEFLKHFLSHIRFCMSEDVSYVAKVLNFMNKTEACDMAKLKRWLQLLADEKQEQKDNHPVKGLDGGGKNAAGSAGLQQNMSTKETPGRQHAFGQPAVPGQHPVSGQQPVPGQSSASGRQSGYKQQAGGLQQPPFRQQPVLQPSASPAVQEPPVKEKKGLFKKKKEREMQIPGIAIPGGPVPTANVPPAAYPGGKAARQPEVVLDANEEGRFLLEQTSKEKKKGLFHFPKKQKAPETPPVPQPVQQPWAPAGTPAPGVRMTTPEPAFRPEPPQQVNPEPFRSPSYSQSSDGHTIYMGSGSSDDENHTVIMGGGEDGHTVMQGAEQYTTAPLLKQAARLTRRRTGQSKEITKEVFHIGREGGFVHFYIGDNPTIGAIHADIFIDGGKYFISDRNSVNHTYVNGNMVMAGSPVQLSSGDVIQLSDEQFEFIIS